MNTEPGLAERQIIIQGGHLNTDRRVTEAQLREALTLIEAELRVDHAYSFRRHKFGKSRRQQDFAPTETHISNPHQLQEWASSERSSLIMIQGAYSERFAIRGLCVDLILTLQTNDMGTEKPTSQRDCHDVVYHGYLAKPSLPSFVSEHEPPL